MSLANPSNEESSSPEKKNLFLRGADKLSALGKRAWLGAVGGVKGLFSKEGQTSTPKPNTEPTAADTTSAEAKTTSDEAKTGAEEAPLTLEEAIFKYNEAVVYGADDAAILGLAKQIDAIGAERKKKPVTVPEALENFKQALEADVEPDVLAQYEAVVDNALFLSGAKRVSESKSTEGSASGTSATEKAGPVKALKDGYTGQYKKSRRVKDGNRKGPSNRRPAGKDTGGKPKSSRNRRPQRKASQGTATK